MMRTSWAVLSAFLAISCVGTTGGELVDFEANAAGPVDATGQPLAFDSDRGWHVTLTEARMHVGAVYLNASAPVSGGQNTSCILPGTYVAEVRQGLDVDLLSATPQPFPTLGHGTTLRVQTAQVWLTVGSINDAKSSASTPVLVLSGTATRGSDERPFDATLTIGSNRIANSGTLVGADPICKERIVTPIGTNVQVEDQGGLLLRIDPRLLFTNVDFGALQQSGDRYQFADDSSDQPSAQLYSNLKAASQSVPGIPRLYEFSWVKSPD